MAIFTAIAATAWWSSTVVATIGATAASTIIAIGQSVVWSMVGQALSRRSVDPQTVKATISQTDQPRIRAYGRNLLGGVRAFYESGQGELFQVVVCHHGQVDGLIQFWWDGKPVETQDNYTYFERYKRAYFNDGSGPGGDFAHVPWRNLGLFPTLWTDEHRLQGQATFLSVFGDPADEKYGKVFPRGPGTSVQAEIRGVRVRDLAGARIYSENAGLCLRDLMTHQDGWAFPSSLLDAESWANFVAICAEDVPLKNGGVEPRYRLCGFYALDEALKDVTTRMLAVCDGQIYETADGKIGVLGGAWSEPDVTITSDDILSFDLGEGFDPLQTYNVLQGSFVSPNHAYQPIEVAEIDGAASDGRRPESFDVDMCPSGSQLQRLMKIKYAKDHRDIAGTIRTNLVGMKARWPQGNGIHTVRLDAPEIGLVGVFEVTSHVFSVPDGFCEIGIASLESPYGWTAATEEKALPPNYSSIPTPDNLTGNPANAVLIQVPVLVSSGVNGIKVAVSVDDPGRNDLRLEAEIARGLITDVEDEVIGTPGLELEVPNDEGVWISMPGSRLRAVSDILNDNTTYTVRIRWSGRTDWVSAGSVTVQANAGQPPAPTQFTITPVASNLTLQWRNATSEFYRTQLYRATTNSVSSASLVATVAGTSGQMSSYTDSPGTSGTYYYWVKTINGSGVQSAATGPVSATINPPP